MGILLKPYHTSSDRASVALNLRPYKNISVCFKCKTRFINELVLSLFTKETGVKCNLFYTLSNFIMKNEQTWSKAVVLTDIFPVCRTCGHRRISVAALYKPY